MPRPLGLIDGPSFMPGEGGGVRYMRGTPTLFTLFRFARWRPKRLQVPRGTATHWTCPIRAWRSQPGRTVRPWRSQPGRTVRPWRSQPGRTVRPWGSQPGRTFRPWRSQPGRTVRAWRSQPDRTANLHRSQQVDSQTNLVWCTRRSQNKYSKKENGRQPTCLQPN